MPDVVTSSRSFLAAQLVEGAADAFLAFDQQFRFTFANPAAERLLGLKESDLLGRSQWEVFPATAGSPLETAYRRAMDKHGAVKLESFDERLQKWFEIDAAPWEPEGLVVQFHDVTARRNRLSAMMEALPVGVALLDAQGGSITSNRKFEEVWGGPPPTVHSVQDYTVFKAWWVENGRQVQPEEWASARAVQHGETVVNQEIEIQRLDGRRAYVWNSAAPLRDAEGRIIGSAVAIMDVTGTTQAENALRENEARLRALADNLPEAVIYRYSTDANGEPHVDFITSGIERLTGIPAAEYMNDPATVERNFLPEDRARLKASIRLSREQLTMFEEELRHRHSVTGEIRWSLLRSTPRRNADGSTTWNGIELDITARKRAELSLRETHEREVARATELQAIMDAAPVAAFMSRDPECHEMHGNRMTSELLRVPVGSNLSESSPQGKLLPIFRAVEDGKEIPPKELPLQKAAATGRAIYNQEMEIHYPDGGSRTLVGNAVPLVSGDGRPQGAVGMFLDITERKQAEAKISQHNTILEGINQVLTEALAAETEKELGRRCMAVAERITASKFGFLGMINAEGLLDDIALSEATWKASQMGASMEQLQVHSSLPIHGMYGRAILDGKGFYTNHPASHPDGAGTPPGHPPITAFLGVPLKHEGKTIGMISVANREGGYRQQDLECLEALAAAVVQVLVRKRAEQAVRAAEERLRQAQKLESIGVLAGGIAHDFNNLLTGILGTASLMQMDMGEDNDQLRVIIESSERAAALTRQLLAYAGKGQFLVTDFDLTRLLRSSADLLRVSIPKSVDVELEVPRNLPMIKGDSSQIQQVIMNMVINAAEAVEGRQDGRVRISAGTRVLNAASAASVGSGLDAGRYLWIAVHDNGCGMDEQTVTQIFDPFFTTKFTGRGLGLAAVQGILKSHKGTITVDSRLDHGSTFTVYLPASEARAETPVHKHAIEARGHGVTVLVVDDEEPVRQFSRESLERLGYMVLVAENGRRALDLLASHAEVDLVVLDIVMPVMGGVEAFSEIRTQWPRVAVLFASGYSLQEAKRLGVPDDLPMIEKPYTMQKLAAAVEKTLHARAQ